VGPKVNRPSRQREEQDNEEDEWGEKGGNVRRKTQFARRFVDFGTTHWCAELGIRIGFGGGGLEGGGEGGKEGELNNTKLAYRIL